MASSDIFKKSGSDIIERPFVDEDMSLVLIKLKDWRVFVEFFVKFQFLFHSSIDSIFFLFLRFLTENLNVVEIISVFVFKLTIIHVWLSEFSGY